MAQTKPIETPRGKLEWVNITGEGKANLSGKMQYVANLVLETPEDIASVEAQINDFWEANKPEKFKGAPKSLGIYDHTTPTGEKDEEGKAIYEPTGKKYLAFKTGVAYGDGKPKVIKVLNSKNNPVVLGDTKIGNGSIGRVAGMMGIYVNTVPGKPNQILAAGVTLYLDAIKLLKLEEFSSGPAFGNEDDDFEPIGEEFVGTEEQSEAGGKPRL